MVKIMMGNSMKNTSGISLLIEEYRKRFRIPENLDHYSDEDFQEAEKKYIKYRLFHGNSKNSGKGH
jgi:hypothetical protein